MTKDPEELDELARYTDGELFDVLDAAIQRMASSITRAHERVLRSRVADVLALVEEIHVRAVPLAIEEERLSHELREYGRVRPTEG